MNDVFLFNQGANLLEIMDCTYAKLTQISSIINCLLCAEDMSKNSIYGTVWAVDSILNELNTLYDELNKRVGEKVYE